MTKRKQVKQGTIKPIRPFKTIVEEAAFWDAHSVVDEIDDGTLVGFHQANKTGIVTVRFSQEDLQRLREEAFQKGIGPTTFIRMWVKERLAATHKRSAAFLRRKRTYYVYLLLEPTDDTDVSELLPDSNLGAANSLYGRYRELCERL